jgi:peptidoglycan/xylan/chitin deacetylase (PgdA/CDA1 family)
VRSRVATTEKVIALTLDDGYHPDLRILDLIASYRLHGTAFLAGQVADADPDFVRRISRLGWMVCSHTYDHKRLTALDSSEIRSEIVRGVNAVARVVGYRCPYFRAPYGAVDERVAAVTDSLGLRLIGWEASISDSAPRGTGPEKQLAIARRDLRRGSILLGHFGGTNSYIVLRRLIGLMLDRGYRIGSVAELISGTIPALAPPATSLPEPRFAAPDAARNEQQRSWTRWPSTLARLSGRAELPLTVLAALAALLLVRRRGLGRRSKRPRIAKHEEQLLSVEARPLAVEGSGPSSDEAVPPARGM